MLHTSLGATLYGGDFARFATSAARGSNRWRVVRATPTEGGERIQAPGAAALFGKEVDILPGKVPGVGALAPAVRCRILGPMLRDKVFGRAPGSRPSSTFKFGIRFVRGAKPSGGMRKYYMRPARCVVVGV